MTKIVQHLNWNLQTYKEREEMVLSLQQDGLLDDLTAYQLNEVNNYLLYSKDIEVEVKLRNPTRPSVSYEELIENGVSETELNRKDVSIYKVGKPKIDRIEDANIPTMKELWEAIEIIKEKYEYIRDVIKGDREVSFTDAVVPTFVSHNFFRGWYIDLCRNQYYLKDIFKPVICSCPSFNHPHGNKDLFGIQAGKYILSNHDHMIDLGNPENVYQLLKQYTSIKEKHYDKMDDDWNYLYDMLDKIISNICWNDAHWDILQMKVNNYSNEEVANYIYKKYDIHYSVNYISTIFRRHISRDIARKSINLAYQWENRNDESKWKTCSRCHNKQLNSVEYFGKNKRVCLICTGKRKGLGRKIKVKGLPN